MKRRPSSGCFIVAMWLMSAPPMKARPPAPENTTTAQVVLARQRQEGLGQVEQRRRIEHIQLARIVVDDMRDRAAGTAIPGDVDLVDGPP